MGSGLQDIPLRRIPEQWDRQWFADFVRDVLRLGDARNIKTSGEIDVSGQSGDFATLSMAIGSIALDKIEPQAGLSVIGNPIDSTATLQALVASADLQVVRRSGLGVGFGIINSAYISDFNEASQDATAALIDDSPSLSWIYDDGADSLVGTVSLAPFTTTDLAEGANLYFTDERAQDAVGTILSDSSRIDLSYNDGLGTISADLIAGSVANSFLASMAQSRIKGRAEGAGTGDATDLTPTEVASIIDGEAISWSALHTFTKDSDFGTPNILLSSPRPVLIFDETDVADADARKWGIQSSGGVLEFRAINAAASVTRRWLGLTRSGVGITDLNFGNTTDNPTYTFTGSGTATFSGQITALRFVPSSSTVPTNGLYLPAANTVGLSTNTTLGLAIDPTRRVYGTALHNNASSPTGTTNQYLASGTYTPTLTNATNVAASTASQCQWMRVGNVVTVSGIATVDPTAAGATVLGISLPLASNFGAVEDCAGVAFANAIAGQGAAIRGDAANDRASMEWIAVDITNQPMSFSFSYEII